MSFARLLVIFSSGALPCRSASGPFPGRLLFAVVLAGLTAVGPAQSQDSSATSSSSADDDVDAVTVAEQTGFFVDLRAGANYRVNGFGTGQPLLDDRSPLSYSSLNLGVVNVSGSVGLLGASFFDFEYESPYPRSDFQEKALAARENREHGLEKYTLGVDLTPLWRFFLPPETPKILVYLPSFKVRFRRELTQNTATVEEEALRLQPDDAPSPPDREFEDLSFREIETGESLSFRTDYRFLSLTWPIQTDYDPEKKEYTEFRLGLSGWHYSRAYVTQFPQVDFDRPVVYEAQTTTLALTGNVKIRQRNGARVRFSFSGGLGDFDASEQEGALDRLFEDAGPDDSDSSVSVSSSNIFSGHLELIGSYRFSAFPDNADVNLHFEPGLNLNVFFNRFEAFDEEVLEDEETDNHFLQADFIFMPTAKVVFSFN